MGHRSVKDAKASDWWRRVYEGARPRRLLRVTLKNLPGIGIADLDVSGPLTAICGLNGSGKTRVMRAIAASFSSSPMLEQPEVRRRVAGTDVTLELAIDGKASGASFRLTESPEPLAHAAQFATLWVDPQLHCLRVADVVENLEGLDEALEQLEPRLCSAEEVARISYVVGREYSQIRVWETDVDELVSPLPYFSVVWRGREYGSEDMGLGELCAHYLVWAISTAPRDALVLLEEPEAFLIPASQRKFMNCLAELACTRRQSVILTTHSASILDRVPIEHVRVLDHTGDGVAATRVRSRVAALRPLGLEMPKVAVLFVEDEAAAWTLDAIVATIDADLLVAADVVPCDGDAGVRERTALWPIDPRAYSAVGVLDGGCEVHDKEPQTLLRLPSDDPPEAYVRRCMRGSLAKVAARLGCTEAALHRADATLEGRDHHDWLPRIAGSLGTSQELFIRIVIQAHADTEVGRAELESFVGRLRALLKAVQ